MAKLQMGQRGDAGLPMRDCPDSILTKHRYVWSPALASITSGIGVTQAGMLEPKGHNAELVQLR